MRVVVRDIGRQAYDVCWRNMQQFTNERTVETCDEIWLVEHPAVFTQGRAGKAEHIISPDVAIPIVHSDRGGQVTYHGPGQLIVYLLIDLTRKKIGIRSLVTTVEQAVLAYLAQQGINAYADRQAPGIYVDGCKLASLGFRVRKGCTYHGLSINVDMDLTPFTQINPCGLAGMHMTQLKDLGVTQSIEQVKHGLLEHLVAQLQYS